MGSSEDPKQRVTDWVALIRLECTKPLQDWHRTVQPFSCLKRRVSARQTTNRQGAGSTSGQKYKMIYQVRNRSGRSLAGGGVACRNSREGFSMVKNKPGSEFEAEIEIVAESKRQQVRVSRRDCCGGAEWQVWDLVLIEAGAQTGGLGHSRSFYREPNIPITIGLYVQTE